MVDSNTKAVLAIIAIGLMVLVVQNAISVSRAKETDLQKVHYCDRLSCATLLPRVIRKHGPRRLLLIEAARMPAARMSGAI